MYVWRMQGIAPWGVPTCDHCADAFHLWISRIHYLAKFVGACPCAAHAQL